MPHVHNADPGSAEALCLNVLGVKPRNLEVPCVRQRAGCTEDGNPAVAQFKFNGFHLLPTWLGRSALQSIRLQGP
jgi:hypothetical protein